MTIIILEPYYGGSHRALVDGLVHHLDRPFTLWTLPPRKWKWRMRGAAPVFAARWREERPEATAIFTSSLLNAAELRGLLPEEARQLPLIVYCHENQLNYPQQDGDPRDYHYGWINILSAMAADRLVWNSRYNLESFLAALPDFVRRMPDRRPRGLVESIRAKSTILPVPIDLEGMGDPAPKSGPPRILWNHRWEHDKGPEEFFAALERLDGEGRDFELSVIVQTFQDEPAVFERAKAKLEGRIRTWGFRESRADYWRELSRADLVISTARHEFQGLAVLEAATAGAWPLLPDDLAYPEIWPARHLYRKGRLAESLGKLLQFPEVWRKDTQPATLARRYAWDELGPRWEKLFQDFC